MNSSQLKNSSFYHPGNLSVIIKRNTDQDALMLQECKRYVCILEGNQQQLQFCCTICFLLCSFHQPFLNCVLKLWFLLCHCSFSKNILSTMPTEKEFHKDKKSCEQETIEQNLHYHSRSILQKSDKVFNYLGY